MEKNRKETAYKPQTQILFIVVVGFLLAIGFAAFTLFRAQASHSDTIYTGVSLEGVDLSGMSVAQAAAAINQDAAYPNTGKLLFTDGEQRWLYTPAQLGFSLNAIESAQEAFAFGRGSGLIGDYIQQISVGRRGVSVAPSFTYDQSQAYAVLQGIATQVDRPVQEAAIGVQGAEVIVTPGQVGRQVDIDATLAVLEGLILGRQDGLVPLVITEVQPEIMDAAQAATLAQSILSQPLLLNAPDGDFGPWTIEPADLAKMILIERAKNGEKAEYVVRINEAVLRIYLLSLAPIIKVEPENARAIFNDDTRQLDMFKSARVGRELDVDASLAEISSKLPAGEHSFSLQVRRVDPAVKDDTTAESLGITELVIAETSYFYGSDAARIQNISASASSFHGVFIPPGATFSMASELTDISLENGYAEALIIVGGETVKGIGGGVCQVSTTLFRTVFFSGYPVVERHAHAYRVSYYEQAANGWRNSNLAGLDATVYVPLVDFKFTNDTPYWLLMETYLEGYSLTWKFYSTKDGRSMDWETSGVTAVQAPPEPIYRENPELDSGVIKQVDWEVEGASVFVGRTVYKDGGVYFTDSFNTYYIPWQAIFEYGPGTEIP